MENNETAIFILSSRTKLLPKCLNLFKKNHPCTYPIYVYHYDDIYTEEDKLLAREAYDSEVNFIQLEYKIPENISPIEIFFNRKFINYVKSWFPPERVGYLHMCNFYTWQAFERPELRKYKYLMRFDDDSWFKKEFPFNLFEEYRKHKNIFCITGYNMCPPEKLGQNNIDTREMLFKFFKYYVDSRNIDVKNKRMKKIIQENNELEFHKSEWKCDLNVWETSVFKTQEWKDWITAVRDYGGIFKHRWGDIEIQTIFSWMYYENGIIDLDLKRKDFYDSHLPEYSEAPRTKIVK